MLRMFAVFDKAVQAFMQPFYARATGEAIRTFTDAVNDAQSPFYKHPNDFELYSVGVFDPASGEITTSEGVVRVLVAADVLNKM